MSRKPTQKVAQPAGLFIVDLRGAELNLEQHERIAAAIESALQTELVKFAPDKLGSGPDQNFQSLGGPIFGLVMKPVAL